MTREDYVEVVPSPTAPFESAALELINGVANFFGIQHPIRFFGDMINPNFSFNSEKDARAYVDKLITKAANIVGASAAEVEKAKSQLMQGDNLAISFPNITKAITQSKAGSTNLARAEAKHNLHSAQLDRVAQQEQRIIDSVFQDTKHRAAKQQMADLVNNMSKAVDTKM